MKIAVCDDEELYRRELQEYLNSYYMSMDVLVETFSSGESFLQKYEKDCNAYELIFLDIEMGGLDGIETAKKIREDNDTVPIIFLTSHAEFAADGYEVDAFRFLTKPVKKIKLNNALQDVQKEWDKNRKIMIKDMEKEILLKYEDIVSMEAQNVNVCIRTLNKEYIIRKTLKQMADEVKGTVFFQPHRSYVVHLGYVTDYDGKTLTMENGDKIPISRNKLSELKTSLVAYVRNCGH